MNDSEINETERCVFMILNGHEDEGQKYDYLAAYFEKLRQRTKLQEMMTK